MRKLFSLCLLSFLFYIGPAVYAADPAKRFIIVVDAGSSGSRLHIFEETTTTPTQLADIKDLTPTHNTVQPGISTFLTHPQDLGPSLKPMLDKAVQVLQAAGTDLSQVQFNLMATAGMRLMPKRDQAVIYQAIENYVKANYPFHIANIKTIAGQMEAVYGWLAVNYLENKFSGNSTTMGSLDLGGASTQIAFISHIAPSLKNVYSFILAGKTYHLFATSFLGLGQDQARLKIGSLACYPSGYKVADLGMGQFNYSNCKAAIDKLLAKYKLGGVVFPVEPGMTYIAYSGYYYAADFFGVKTPKAFEETVQNVCVKSWDELQKLYPKVPAKYLANYCFNGVYIHQLLTQGYRFPAETKQIEFDNQIGSREIDWSIGVAVANSIKPL